MKKKTTINRRNRHKLISPTTRVKDNNNSIQNLIKKKCTSLQYQRKVVSGQTSEHSTPDMAAFLHINKVKHKVPSAEDMKDIRSKATASLELLK